MNFGARAMHERRHFLGQAAVAGLALAVSGASGDQPRPDSRPLPLGFSLYGMKSLAGTEALRKCRQIGYECCELPVMADWPADAARLTELARRELKQQFADAGLRLSALMEN